MTISLAKIEVGPWPMNSYLINCDHTGISAVIDPGADADQPFFLLEGLHLHFHRIGNFLLVVEQNFFPDHLTHKKTFRFIRQGIFGIIGG